ncbi:MAG: hypothetical protein NXH75_11125 [Halobacteriovoraceae bacterium]|nr:hypothetical protein [Halobacteriovoraceae bacterium]
MCDVCHEEEIDWKFRNGKRPLHNCRLYRVYQNRVANIKLCHIHAIELFCVGESRFLEFHPRLAIMLHTSSRGSQSSNDIFAFS